MSNRLFSDPDKMVSDLFDNKSIEKVVRRTFIGAIIVWGLGMILSLALTGGIIYVAYHFISKFW